MLLAENKLSLKSLVELKEAKKKAKKAGDSKQDAPAPAPAKVKGTSAQVSGLAPQGAARDSGMVREKDHLIAIECDAGITQFTVGSTYANTIAAVKEASRPCRLVFMRPPPWEWHAAARAGDATYDFIFARPGGGTTTTLCTPALCAALQRYFDIKPGTSTFVDVAADASASAAPSARSSVRSSVAD